MSWEETPWMTDNEVLAARKAYFDRKMAIMDARSAMMEDAMTNSFAPEAMIRY